MSSRRKKQSLSRRAPTLAPGQDRPPAGSKLFPPDVGRNPWRLDRAAAFQLLVLSAVSFALYARTLWNSFAADDESEVLKDSLIRRFANIPTLFAHGVWFFAGSKTDNYYRPLKLLAYSVEYHLFGFRPAFWHLSNILFNLAVIFVIYFLVRDLASGLPARSFEGMSAVVPPWGTKAGQLAFWSALFFAFHPIHVEAVAWIAAGNDLLCGLALLLALWLYHRALYRTEQGGTRLPRPEDSSGHLRRVAGARRGGKPAPTTVLLYAGSVTLFFAGLLFKETALTFPAVILAYDYFYRGESLVQLLRAWRRYLAYFAALGIYLALRIHALRGFAPRINRLDMTIEDTVLSVPVLAVQYVWKTLVPTNLNFWHVYEPTRALGWRPIGAIAVVVGLILAMFWLGSPDVKGVQRAFKSGRGPDVEREQGVFESGRGRQPLLSFALAWFWLTLIPVLDIPHVNKNVFTERYLYIPTFGVCILAAWAWLWLCGRAVGPRAEVPQGGTNAGKPASRGVGRAAAYACLLALFAFCTAVILRRLPDWQDQFHLLTKTVQQSPDAPNIQSDLGILYKDKGLFSEALWHAQRAVALEPAGSRVHNNLASVFLALGRDDEALREIQEAIQLEPGVPGYWQNLALIYQTGKDWGKAIEACRRGLAIDPSDRALLDTLGLALWRNGQPDEALEAYRRAIQVEPDNLNAYVNLASSLAQLGQLDAAADQLVTGLSADPGSPNTYLGHYELGVIYRDKGLWQQATGQFQQALETKPDFAPARTQLEAARAHLANPQP